MAMPKVSRYRQQWCSNRRLGDFLKMMKARESMSAICGLGLRTLVSYTSTTSVSVPEEDILAGCTRVCCLTATAEPFLPTPPFKMT